MVSMYSRSQNWFIWCLKWIRYCLIKVRHLKEFCFFRQIVYKETVLSEYIQEVAFLLY